LAAYKFDADAKRRFLAYYEQHGRFYQAANAAGVSGETVYRCLHGDSEDSKAFAAEFEECKGRFRDLVEQEVHRRAIEGYDEYVVGKGGLVMDKDGNPVMQRRYSDRLLELFSKRHIKEYRDKQDAPVTNVTNVLVIPAGQSVDQWQAAQLALQGSVVPVLPPPKDAK